MLKIFFLSLVFWVSAASAIELPKDVPEKHSFNEARWEKITKGIDYSKEGPPPEDKVYKPGGGFNLSISPAVGKAIIFTIVFALLIFILVRVLKGNLLLGDKKITDGNAFMDVSPDEDIHRSNLEELYAQALAAANFRLAVRYGYLIIIRELSNKHLITWKKEKTNTDYIFEMMNNVFDKSFRENTFLFEKIWYGRAELSEQNFQLINSRFNEFIGEVKKQSQEGEVSKSPANF